MRPPKKRSRRSWPAPTRPTTTRRSGERKETRSRRPGPRPRGDARREDGRGARRRAPADDAAGRRAVLRYYDRAVFGFAAALAGGAIPDASVESVVAAMVQYADRALQVRLALPAPAVARDARDGDERRSAFLQMAVHSQTFVALGRAVARRAEAAAAPPRLGALRLRERRRRRRTSRTSSSSRAAARRRSAPSSRPRRTSRG